MSSKSLRIGVVGIAGGWSSETLADAVERATGYRLLVEMRECCAELSAGRVWCRDVDLCELDGLIVKKIGTAYNQDMLDRLELLRFIESRGVRVFSNANSMLRLLDRLSCTVTLAAAGIPIPETTITEDVARGTEMVKRYGAAVLKPLYSTKARGMELIDSHTTADVEARVRAFREAGNPVMYIQRKVNIPGRDLGVVFMGGEHVGTYARVKSDASWNTTTRDGGHYDKHDADQATIELARRAQALFELDITSVDVVETEEGPRVFEVSAFGGFRGMKDALGIDAAQMYAQYAVKELSK